MLQWKLYERDKFFWPKVVYNKFKGLGLGTEPSYIKPCWVLRHPPPPPPPFVCLFVLQQTTALNRNLSDTFIEKTLIGDFRLKLSQPQEGNPFKPFWDELGVDFEEKIVYHLGIRVHDPYERDQWKKE